MDSDADSFAVELVWADGRSETLTVAPDEVILDVAAASDVALPYGCRFGACATCTGKVVHGSVSHVKPPRGLKESALDEGYALLCVATPTTDCRVRVGHEIQAAVVGTPWK
ncbi:2Fe-2S iron-sulfur cluster-binding protein [Haloarculaceae archaeon H-GB2-1]|nr:2Fe-2S iron-sulfur cluster-binding protein [Haloarculaceae archaeon H-GB1-1]MEA5385934.1 2Fe-2S iron-sulfur cluster-binding protein [Haloarculaceae archaeon H-GB11]MEA5407441.1 2Fe-2S iron-sulfur cluster-binding protein [Haloarculaceae archaeon H-GB2-1]